MKLKYAKFVGVSDCPGLMLLFLVLFAPLLCTILKKKLDPAYTYVSESLPCRWSGGHVAVVNNQLLVSLNSRRSSVVVVVGNEGPIFRSIKHRGELKIKEKSVALLIFTERENLESSVEEHRLMLGSISNASRGNLTEQMKALFNRFHHASFVFSFTQPQSPQGISPIGYAQQQPSPQQPYSQGNSPLGFSQQHPVNQQYSPQGNSVMGIAQQQPASQQVFTQSQPSPQQSSPQGNSPIGFAQPHPPSQQYSSQGNSPIGFAQPHPVYQQYSPQGNSVMGTAQQQPVSQQVFAQSQPSLQQSSSQENSPMVYRMNASPDLIIDRPSPRNLRDRNQEEIYANQQHSGFSNNDMKISPHGNGGYISMAANNEVGSMGNNVGASYPKFSLELIEFVNPSAVHVKEITVRRRTSSNQYQQGTHFYHPNVDAPLLYYGKQNEHSFYVVNSGTGVLESFPIKELSLLSRDRWIPQQFDMTPDQRFKMILPNSEVAYWLIMEKLFVKCVVLPYTQLNTQPTLKCENSRIIENASWACIYPIKFLQGSG